MTFVIDIDDTIIKSLIENCKECGYIKYKDVKPIQDEIDEINKKFKEGHTIILYSGNSYNPIFPPRKFLFFIRFFFVVI